LTHSNLNYLSSYNESENYSIDYSLVEQPVVSASSGLYLLALGFYHTFETLIDELADEWWFLAIILALLSTIIILYLTLKGNMFMQIPISIGMILLILILLDVLLLGLDVFAGSDILLNIHGIIEIFFSIMIRLLPFIFIVWCIFFITYLIKTYLITKK